MSGCGSRGGNNVVGRIDLSETPDSPWEAINGCPYVLIDVPKQGDPKYLLVGGGLKLDEGMEAGNYILQVIVRDHLVEKLLVSTNQSTTFKVEPGP